jgi:hypothetical protein
MEPDFIPFGVLNGLKLDLLVVSAISGTSGDFKLFFIR